MSYEYWPPLGALGSTLRSGDDAPTARDRRGRRGTSTRVVVDRSAAAAAPSASSPTRRPAGSGGGCNPGYVVIWENGVRVCRKPTIHRADPVPAGDTSSPPPPGDTGSGIPPSSGDPSSGFPFDASGGSDTPPPTNGKGETSPVGEGEGEEETPPAEGEGEEEPSWWEQHKLKVGIGAAAVIAGTLAYFAYLQGKKKPRRNARRRSW